ncbi:MAG: uracil-DNA glycosylase [Gammaproteobacteria bacterium]|nr:uracil-DNA glycosylase [Gammaproteobacteria bacterium]
MVREDLRKLYLTAMGIQAWERRGLPVEAGIAAAAEHRGSATLSDASSEGSGEESQTRMPQPAANTESPGMAGMDWGGLEQAVRGCSRCRLHEGRTHTVFGTGNRRARWMFVGEAPGAEEDRQGEPFVGRAGQLLNSMLYATGLGRDEVYIANVIKCRPPNNRDPLPDEVQQCEPYLLRQIGLIQPRLIVALGRHAAHSLLKTELALGKLRGQSLNYHGIPLIVTYHPAYLLRNPADKRKAWEDLRRARKLVETVP